MWYEDRQNLVALANYLRDDGEWQEYSTKEHKDDPVKRMIYFLSKPWIGFKILKGSHCKNIQTYVLQKNS